MTNAEEGKKQTVLGH